MLKISASLLFVFCVSAVSANSYGPRYVLVDITRDYMFLNPLIVDKVFKSPNFPVSRYAIEKGGDLIFRWNKTILDETDDSNSITGDISIEYTTSKQIQSTNFTKCDIYKSHTLENLAQDLFHKIFADFHYTWFEKFQLWFESLYKSTHCPSGKDMDVISPTNIQWERKSVSGINYYEDIIVNMKLYHTDNSKNTNLISHSIYTGTFKYPKPDESVSLIGTLL